MQKRYSVREVADIFGFTPETVRRWYRRGELKGTKMGTAQGSRLVFTATEIARFRAEFCVSNSDPDAPFRVRRGRG